MKKLAKVLTVSFLVVLVLAAALFAIVSPSFAARATLISAVIAGIVAIKFTGKSIDQYYADKENVTKERKIANGTMLLCVVAFFVGSILGGSAITAEKEAKKAAEIAQLHAQTFNAQKPAIIAELNGYLAKGQFDTVLTSVEKLGAVNDADLAAIAQKAKAGADKKAARKAQIETQFSAWDGSHRTLEKAIKAAMNDPKSYEHIETKYTDYGDHLVVLTTYRGKNGFGAMVKGYVKAKVDLNGNIIKVLQQG